MESRLDQSSIERTSLDIGVATARAAIEWASRTFPGRVCLLASMQDTVLIDLAMGVDASIPVVFLDTGYHFAETLETMARVERRYGITVEVHGPIHEVRDDILPGECCDSKLDLLASALTNRSAWMSGIRRTQTADRSATSLIDTDKRGMAKISPLAQWNDDDVTRYSAARDVITHPLLAEGYDSIGCEPCTTRPTGQDARSGRWAGSQRTECGLHL